MTIPDDTAPFLHAIFGDQRQEVMRFKWEFGSLLKPLLAPEEIGDWKSQTKA